MTMQNVSKAFTNIAKGSALGALASRIPELARQIDFAAEMERTRAALETLGAQSPEIARMERFIIALAGTTVAPNREVIRAAANYNLYRMARGESFVPDDITAWAKGFMRHSLAAILDSAYKRMGVDFEMLYLLDPDSVRAVVDTYLADARRLWSDVEI
jgi:hypothetical protein